MSVSEKLLSYSNQMNVRFLVKHIYAIEKLELEIGTYLQRFITSKGTRIDFKSCEIRHFILPFEKAHKSLNKITSFTELNKKFDKYNIVGCEELRKELKVNRDMIHLITKTQFLLASFNRYATLLAMLEESIENSNKIKEEERRKEEEESDNIFRHCVYESLVEACSGRC